MPDEKTEAKKEEKSATINFNKQIKKRSGGVLRYRPEFKEDHDLCDECTEKIEKMLGDPMTVGSLCTDALDSMPQPDKGEKKVSYKEKYRRGKLAEKIYESDGPMDLSVADRALIKKLIGEIQTPLVVSQIFPEIDPKFEEDEGD